MPTPTSTAWPTRTRSPSSGSRRRGRDGALLVEWPERAGGLLPEERLTVTLRHGPGESPEAREVEVVGPERFAALCR